MSINIKIPDETFNFSELSLGEPNAILNGFYFSEIKYNNDLFIQTPEVSCKNGFVKSGNKTYIDIIFKQNHEQILEWFENLENRIKVLIFEKRNDWFNESNIEMSDIENIFISPIRSQKSGKQFILRSNIESAKNSFVNVNNFKVYNINQQEVDISSINNNTNFISILKISGIKFSSRTFQIYIEIKQVMIMENNIFTECLINKPDTIKGNIPIMLNSKNVESNDNSGEESQLKNQEESELQEKIEKEVSIEDELSKVKSESSQEVSKDIGQELAKDIGKEVAQEIIEEITEKVPQEVQQEVSQSQSQEVSQELPKVVSEENKQDLEIIEMRLEDKSNLEDDNTSEKKEENNNLIINKTTQDNIAEVDVKLDTLEKVNIQLQDPDIEHIELYRSALKKAKELRKQAVESHLQAQDIKAKYLLNVYSESESDSDYTDSENEEPL